MLPLFLLLLYGVTELGLRFVAENRVDTATEAGVSVGVVNWGQEGFAEAARDAVVEDLSIASRTPEVVVVFLPEDERGQTPWAADLGVADISPMGCSVGHECIRYELQTDGTYATTVDGIDIGALDECAPGLLGVSTLDGHSPITPIEFLGGDIVRTKIREHLGGPDCFGGDPSDDKAIQVVSILETTPNDPVVTTDWRPIRTVAQVDTLNMLTLPGQIFTFIDADFQITANAELNGLATVTQGVVEIGVFVDGELIGSSTMDPTVNSAVTSIALNVTSELQAEQVLTVQLRLNNVNSGAAVGIDSANPASTTFIAAALPGTF